MNIALGASVFCALLWSSFAIRYWNRGSARRRSQLAWAWGIGWLGLHTLTACSFWSLASFAVAFAVLLVAWLSIPACKNLTWEPWYARQSRGDIEGDTLTIRELRNFRWSSRSDFTGGWETRTFDLTEVKALDFVTSSWGQAGVVHTLACFWFGGSDYLALSVETRLERGEDQNPIKGLFKQYELIYLFADERDVLALRTNVRLEETRIFPTTLDPGQVRRVLEGAVREANALGDRPRFYNTVWRNCTTGFLPILEGEHALGFDLSKILNAGFDKFGIEQGLIDTDLDVLRAREHFAADELGRATQDLESFSMRVRPWRHAAASEAAGQAS